MKTLYCLIVSCLLCGAVSVQGQEVSNRHFDPQTPVAYPKPAMRLFQEVRSPLQLPKVGEYIVLKCDFHTHTVFSDGSVWPTTRIEEAFREGLDVLAITEHLEFHHLHAPDVNAKNLNREYEIAKGTADQLGIMLIPGAEVTREVPAGHFNVLFLKDANLLEKFINYENHYDPANLTETLQAAKDQGAFIFWNHPSYKHPKRIAEWYDLHENLYQKGLIMGLEAANSNMYIPLVHQWAEEKKLTLFSNSDFHGTSYITPGAYRPMTLVFARERSPEAVREALVNRRTVAFAQNYLYGERALVDELFRNSVEMRCLSSNDRQTTIEISNRSGLPFDVELLENDSFVPGVVKRVLLYGGKTTAIVLSNKAGKPMGEGAFKVQVNNIHSSAAVPLQTELSY